MKRIIVSILSLIFLVACVCLCACGEGGGGDTGTAEQGEYIIRYYFENEQGDFVHDSSKDETGTKDIGATVSVRNPKTFDGYIFDASNERNWTYDIIREDKTIVLELYYKQIADGETPSEPSTPKNGYVVKYYFENELGEFVHDETKNAVGEGEVGKTVNATPETFDYYVFDAQNAENVVSGVIDEENTLELKLYYERTTYSVTVSGGTADKTQVKWGEKVNLTLDNSLYYWVITSGEQAGAVLNGNVLTVGKSDVSVEGVGAVVLNVLNSNYVKEKNQEIKATLSVSNVEAKQGIVSLYNTADTINTLNAKESYYLFATQGGKAVFNLYNGESFVEIKSADITALSVGDHEYKLQINADGSIVCSLDNNQVLTVSESDVTAKGCSLLTVAGRVGTYNENGKINSQGVSVVSGDMTLDEIKAHFNTVLGRVSANYYVFNAKELIIENKKEEIPFSWIYGFGAQAETFKNQIYACENIAGLVAFAANKQVIDAVKVAALQQQVKAAFGSFIQLYNDCLLMPMVSASQVEAIDKGTGNVACVMSADVFAGDTRWWVPNAYMLYSTWPAPNNMGIMNMLESEVDSASDFNALYNISDKYIADVVRALSFKGLEFYYWHEYNKDAASVVSEWCYLYTYYGAAGENFVYIGNAFTDYAWTMDYRLPSVFFDKTNEAFSNDPQTIMNNYTWMLNHQMLADANYTVTLNAVGGTVDTTTLTSSSAQGLALPTPTKTGATFDGWYLNRAYEGAPLTAIAAYSNRKDVTLYAKWIVYNAEQTLTADPADIFGNHMIIQQKKPFNVFGTGTDGVSVTVSLDGVTKTATVANGKWSVTFDAMDATWTAKTLTVSGGETRYVFTDILVGEVWLGAGQSNMQMTLSWMNGTGINYVGQYGYYDNFNKIRIYRQQIPGTAFAGDEANTNNWVTMDKPNDALAQSAYSVSFALNLQKKLGVPVGVINSCMGATYIEEWLSNESLSSTGSVIKGTDEENEESRYYYGMTELLRGISVSGVIWYQGENNAYAYNYPDKYPNASGVDYGAQLVALHGQYKDIFGDANLPLIVTELAPYAWDDYEDFRIVQREFVTENANAYLLSTVDIGEAYDIHPVYKNELGKRAANIALEFVYQAEGVSDTLSYIPVSATQNGGTITLTFEAGKTIEARGALIGFKVENEQGVLASVTATVSGNTVSISYTGNAVKVYYMYVKDAVGVFNPNLSYYIGVPGLYGGNGLPVAPFAIAVENA